MKRKQIALTCPSCHGPVAPVFSSFVTNKVDNNGEICVLVCTRATCPLCQSVILWTYQWAPMFTTQEEALYHIPSITEEKPEGYCAMCGERCDYCT